MQESGYRIKVSRKVFRAYMLFSAAVSLCLTVASVFMFVDIMNAYAVIKNQPTQMEQDLMCWAYQCDYPSDFVLPVVCFVLFFPATILLVREAFTKRKIRYVREIIVEE